MTFSRITGVQGTSANIPTGVAPSAGGGNVTVRKFSFAYNTPGLLAGTAAVYTPTIGDVLMDAWVSITTPWNGTTPLFDFGQDLTFGGFYEQLTLGLFHPFDSTPPTFFPHMNFGDLSTADTVGGTRQPGQLTSIAQIGGLSVLVANVVDGTGLVGAGDEISWTTPSPLVAGPGGSATTGLVVVPSVFVSADPIQIVVSRSGSPGGADPGSTQGAATLYLAISTPA